MHKDMIVNLYMKNSTKYTICPIFQCKTIQKNNIGFVDIDKNDNKPLKTVRSYDIIITVVDECADCGNNSVYFVTGRHNVHEII